MRPTESISPTCEMVIKSFTVRMMEEGTKQERPGDRKKPEWMNRERKHASWYKNEWLNEIDKIQKWQC